jgi:hypothetical protein
MSGNIVRQAARIQISEATRPKLPLAVAGPTGPICGPTRNRLDGPDLFQDTAPQMVEAEGTQNIALCEEIRGTFLEATRCNAATNDPPTPSEGTVGSPGVLPCLIHQVP